MGLPELRGIAIVLSLIGFIGIFWWAFTRRNTQRFDEASKLPFTEDESLEPRPEHSEPQPHSKHSEK